MIKKNKEMEKIFFTDPALILAANELAKKPKRLKIANWISLALLILYLVSVALLTRAYLGGSIAYHSASAYCMLGMLITMIAASVVRYLPFNVKVEEYEIEKAKETVFLSEELRLKEKISEAEKEVAFIKCDLEDSERDLVSANDDLRSLYEKNIKNV